MWIGIKNYEDEGKILVSRLLITFENKFIWKEILKNTPWSWVSKSKSVLKMVGLQPWPPNTEIAFWFLAWSWFDLNSSFKNPGKHLNWDWFDWTFSRHWLWFDWTVHVLTLIWLNRSCIDSNLIKPFLYWHWFDWTFHIYSNLI